MMDLLTHLSIETIYRYYEMQGLQLSLHPHIYYTCRTAMCLINIRDDLDLHKRLQMQCMEPNPRQSQLGTQVMVLSLSCFQSRVTADEERLMCHSCMQFVINCRSECRSLVVHAMTQILVCRGFSQRSTCIFFLALNLQMAASVYFALSTESR